MKRLFDTTITKKDTCLSYALKRTNTETTIEFAEDLEKEFDLIPVKDTKLEIGDIVAWIKKEEVITAATSIRESGNILYSPVDTKLHIGVVEDFNRISDLTRSANAYYIPSIRLRSISLIGGNYQTFCPVPDFVIRKKVN
ncbi:hypothetical protein [Elizabethkingia miricola]|uniref:hypothetical protein n=1 Tax=Elizabethkingia miricola TaxID=172045 RepID=UPI00099A7506|nr:hypothetical protein [Elizabethkingia miricola]OPC36182.1 hypothetical protein BAX99_19180 [Elizabethkingia miricola]